MALHTLATSPATADVRINHPRGFSIEVPRSLVAERIPDGFRIHPQNADELRAPFEMIIVFSTEPLPPKSWPQSKCINDRVVWYRNAKQPGGSGGDIHSFEAWISYMNGKIEISYHVQSEELTPPQLPLVWQIISSIDLGTGVRLDYRCDGRSSRGD